MRTLSKLVFCLYLTTLAAPSVHGAQVTPVGPAIRPDDHRLACTELRREYAELGDREQELSQAERSAASRDDIIGATTSFIGGIVGQLGARVPLATGDADNEVRVQRAAVAARRERVAELMNDRKC